MPIHKQEVLRLEFQIGELIRLVANLNERILKLENESTYRKKILVKSTSVMEGSKKDLKISLRP